MPTAAVSAAPPPPLTATVPAGMPGLTPPVPAAARNPAAVTPAKRPGRRKAQTQKKTRTGPVSVLARVVRPTLTSLLHSRRLLGLAVVLPIGVTGLVNLGNTCYLNAVLQTLAAVGCGENARPLSEQAAPVTVALRLLCLRTTTSPC